MLLNQSSCQTSSTKRKIGLCDDPHPANNPAYINEDNGKIWLATVVNEEPPCQITFTAIDHCVDSYRPDGKMHNRCDGILSFNSTLIFVELKDRTTKNNQWVLDAEVQLRASIENFKNIYDLYLYKSKKAYIANKQQRGSKVSQNSRVKTFLKETDFLLVIDNRIVL